MQKNIFFKIILLVCVFGLFENQNIFADSKIDQKEPGVSDLNDVLNSFTSSVATSPECYINITDIITYGAELAIGIGAMTFGVTTINSGMAMIASPLIFTQIAGFAAITTGGISFAGGMLSIGKLIMDASGQSMCYLSFVRDPISYYPDFIPDDHPDKAFQGKMKGFDIDPSTNKFKGFKAVSNYWEAAPSHNSNKITVCARSPFTFAKSLFTFSGCHGKNQVGWLTGSANFEKQPDYNGQDSLLCPEEYRQIGRKPIDGTNPWDTKKLACREYDGKKCGDSSFKSQQNSLKDFKLTFGTPECKTLEFSNKDEKKTTVLHGFKYTAKAKGSKICAYLTHALGFVPLNKQWNIGCINKKSFNVMPKCPASKPIYENFKIDPSTGGIIDFGDPQYNIIQYDNSDCLNSYNSCGISALCKNHLGNKIFQAPIPITSYIVGCLTETSNNLFYGCGENSSNQNKHGMLSVFQQRLRPIVFLAMVLAIFIFAFKILFIDSQIKASDFTIFLMKIAFVIYFTNQTGSGSSTHNGIQIYSGFLSTASTGLQDIVLKAASHSNGICKYDDSRYDSQGVKGKYLYLKVWDILDCRMIYYITTSFWPFNKPFDSNMFEHVGAFIGYGLSFIVMILGLIFFTIFLFFWVMMIVELVIVTGILFSILILLSPIFVVLILFGPTKKMFDQWVSKLVTFSLYPVLIFAFLGFSFIMVDRIAFGETEFVMADEEDFILGQKVSYFKVNDSKDFSSKCAGIEPGLIPRGCDCSGANCLLNLVDIKSKDSGTFLGKNIGAEVNTSDTKVVKSLHRNVLSLLLMIFVMYHLTKQINMLLDVLSGSSLTLGQINARAPHSRMEGFLSNTGLFRKSNKNKKNKEEEGEKKTTKRSKPSVSSDGISPGFGGDGSGSDASKSDGVGAKSIGSDLSGISSNFSYSASSSSSNNFELNIERDVRTGIVDDSNRLSLEINSGNENMTKIEINGLPSGSNYSVEYISDSEMRNLLSKQGAFSADIPNTDNGKLIVDHPPQGFSFNVQEELGDDGKKNLRIDVLNSNSISIQGSGELNIDIKIFNPIEDFGNSNQDLTDLDERFRSQISEANEDGAKEGKISKILRRKSVD